MQEAYPPPVLGSDLDGGGRVPPSEVGQYHLLRWVPPCLDLGRGYPPAWTWEGVPPPGPGKGYPLAGPGGTPHLDLGRWYPPPPRNGGQSENITFRHPSDAGGNQREVI